MRAHASISSCYWARKYTLARLKLKSPNGPPPKGTVKKPASKAKAKAKPVSKWKKADDDKDEEPAEESQGNQWSQCSGAQDPDRWVTGGDG